MHACSRVIVLALLLVLAPLCASAESGYPWSIWAGTTYIPGGSSSLYDRHNLVFQGRAEQGWVAADLGSGFSLIPYAALTWNVDTVDHPWDNFVQVAAGVKVRKHFDTLGLPNSAGFIDVGVEVFGSRQFRSDPRSGAGVMVRASVNFWGNWKTNPE